MNNSDQRLKAIKSKILTVQLFGAPGAILLGLGLYGMFGANGHAFHPALNDARVVYSLIAAGVTIEIWQFIQLLPLLKQQAQINNEKKP